jgi:hypothetical protein
MDFCFDAMGDFEYIPFDTAVEMVSRRTAITLFRGGVVEMKKVTLCSGSKCCPEAIIDKENVTIRDDDGNEVKLTKEQVKILWENL